MSGIINQVGARSGIISGGGTASAGTVTLAGTTGLDYEEGTFVPSLSGGGTGFNIVTGAWQTFGSYTKIGRVVHFSLRVTVDAFSTPSGGTLDVTGLPFVMATVSTGHTDIFLGNSRGIASVDGSLSTFIGRSQATGGTSTLSCRQGRGTASDTSITGSNFGATGSLSFCGCYKTESGVFPE